jgi:hypothetical protein
MGVFDYLRCEYPLPDPKHNLIEWQTKDTPSPFLMDYTITQDGRLLESQTQVIKDKEAPLGFFIEKTGELLELPFDGDLHFYTNTTEDGRLEYRATFRKGRVTEMARIGEAT